MAKTSQEISLLFRKAKVDRSWSFDDNRSTDTWTHGFHRYPAKFLPELVKKLIERYAKKDDLVADLFAGCGTTLVESKIHGKRCVGVDINPVSRLITEAKTNAIEPRKLDRYFQKVLRDISKYKYDKSAIVQKHQRLVYWFGKRRRAKIDYLYKSIAGLRDKNVKIFFQCALSNILKNCSRWLQTSTKPQIDPDKKSADPFLAFKYQAKRMISQNKTYYNHLKAQKILSTSCKIKLADAKHTGIRSNSVGIIITSPPYVTSYEYADIHQLTGYWFSYFKNIHTFRRKFIGTFYSGNNSLVVNGALAQQTVQKLFSKDPRTAKEVANFFNDMDQVTREMNRILRKDGKACIVIGNTRLLGVKIKTAEVLAGYLLANNLKIKKVVRRSIPWKHKLIPTIRDKVTGRFSTIRAMNSTLVYPNEYIIIASKAA